VVELGALDPATMGTPQGGIISLLLANVALDGMERLFGAERADGRQVTPCLWRGSNRGINLVRYADDFVVTAPSREVLEGYVIPRLGWCPETWCRRVAERSAPSDRQRVWRRRASG
jgi:RNA-directed DNA polymerase